jgi:hypothetical protein
MMTSLAAVSPAVGQLLHYELHRSKTVEIEPGADVKAPTFNDGSFIVFDLMVTGDPKHLARTDWTGIEIVATIDGPAEFWHHPLARDTPPNAAFVSRFPALAYDTYFAAKPGTAPSFIGQPMMKPQRIEAAWFDVVEDGAEPYLLARLTVHHLDAHQPTWLNIRGSGSDARRRFRRVYFDFLEPVMRCPGDLNGDATLDLGDVDSFLAGRGVLDACDLDGDGDHDDDDLAVLLSLLADGNGDGKPDGCEPCEEGPGA